MLLLLQYRVLTVEPQVGDGPQTHVRKRIYTEDNIWRGDWQNNNKKSNTHVRLFSALIKMRGEMFQVGK